MKHTSTKIFHQFFHWYCDPKVLDYMLSLSWAGIIKPTEGYKNLHTGMYKSYFKIEWRNLLKNTGYSVISLGGLALAESFCSSY